MAILDRFRKKKGEEATSPEQKSAKPVKKAAASKSSKAAKPAEKTAAPKKAAKTDAAETVVGRVSGGEHLSHRLLLKPHVSEKAARLADKNVYVFDVRTDAEKVAIAKAVEAMYKVEVERVRIVRGIGKPIKRGRRMSRRKAWKKALVQVKPGQTIDLYEGV